MNRRRLLGFLGGAGAVAVAGPTVAVEALKRLAPTGQSAAAETLVVSRLVSADGSMFIDLVDGTMRIGMLARNFEIAG